MLIRSLFGEASIKIEEKLREFVVPPTAVISSPSPSDIYKVFDPITFDGSESYDQFHKIVGYYWDFDGDYIIDSKAIKINFSYFEPGEYNVTLKVVSDEGGIGAASQIVNVYTRNRKRAGLENSLFLIRDNDRNNTQNILRLIPVTTWNDADGMHNIPYYVYYTKDIGSSLTEAQLKELMERYGKKHAYSFDDPNIPCCKFNWGNVTKVNDIDEVYFDFWELYDYVVLVDPEEYPSLLISSLFASFYNSPIIFIDKSNLQKYKAAIRNNGKTRRVYYIPSVSSIDTPVHSFIIESGLDYHPYSTQELRDPQRRVNRIIKLNSNVTMKS